MSQAKPPLISHQDQPWFSPSRHADRRPFLVARAKIFAKLRQWFAARDFMEVDVPALCISPGNETHLHGFRTEIINPGGEQEERYLHTSPEFACKKLLAAGERRIYALGHVFRNRERTALHSPEFTMLEWYRVGTNYEAVVDDCLALVRLAAEVAGTRLFTWKGGSCDPFAEAEWLSVGDAFTRYAGVDLMAATTRDALAKVSPVATASDDTWSDIFSRILVEKIEPQLGNSRLTVLHLYPVAEAALARPCPSDPRVAERAEIYACGVELCNGFGELTDATEQRRRFTDDMDLKQKIYGERYPLDEELLSALSLMPQASGMALGLDRVIMLAAGARSVAEVQWAPS